MFSKKNDELIAIRNLMGPDFDLTKKWAIEGQEGEEVVLSLEQFEAVIRAAAKLGNPKAVYLLARIESGISLQSDFERAFNQKPQIDSLEKSYAKPSAKRSKPKGFGKS